MARRIVKLAAGEYVEWSVIVDGPVGYIMTRDEAIAEWGRQHLTVADYDYSGGLQASSDLPTVEQFIAGNRAGEDGSELTLAEIRDQYAGRWVVRLADGEYIGWANWAEAPIGRIMTREQAVEVWGLERVDRADAHVSSALHVEDPPATAEQFVRGNRAGEGRRELTLDEIRAKFAPEPDDESGNGS
jgi:hypothetical protein